MYNSSETSTRIRQLAKAKGIQMAELLECSVDYLLGRTDNPNETGISVTDNNQMSLTGNNSISVNSAVPNKDTLTEQFMQKF